MFLDVLYEVDFALKIEDSLCLLPISLIEIKHKTRHCQGDHLFLFVQCIKEG